ncbi:MAG: hypothetical protein RIQ93_2105 [Verrucomicrobiota bacterium]|jgi:hypothetical protein
MRRLFALDFALVGLRKQCAVLGALWIFSAAQAQSIQLEPLPDLRIPGYRFPENEATLTRWIMAMSRSSTATVVDHASAKIHLHGWGLWTALTSLSAQSSGGQRLRVFESWMTADELATNPEIATAPWKPAARRRGILKPLAEFQAASAEGLVPDSRIDRVLGFTKYDPSAAAHIARQDLLNLSTLDTLLQAGAQEIPPFPATALAVKPVFQIVTGPALVDGRYFLLKAWSGPPEIPQAFAPSQWPGAVWIDVWGEGLGDGSIDFTAAADGSGRTEATTYPLSNFIHYQLSAADAGALNQAKPSTGASAGDYAVLVAMHVSSRETARWTWQTFWWAANPDDPGEPSSPVIARARPAQLRGAARHYAMALAYTLLSPDQPYVGGENIGAAVYAYNPYIEARFGPADLPDSRPGYTPAGAPARNNVGVQSNCMSCHMQATYNPRRLATAPRFAGARYVDLGAADFTGTLQVDFLWSLPRHARAAPAAKLTIVP